MRLDIPHFTLQASPLDQLIGNFFEMQHESLSERLSRNVRFAAGKLGFACDSRGRRRISATGAQFMFGTSAAIATTMLSFTPASAVATACVPLIVPIEPPLNALDPRVVSALSDSPKLAAGNIATVSGIQGSLAAAEFFLADPTTGVAHGILAGFGFFILSPEGMALLPTYAVITGVNSVMGLIKLMSTNPTLQALATVKFPLIAGYLKICNIGHPVLYALSCYYSWSLLEGIRDSLIPSLEGAPTNLASNTRPQSRELTPFQGLARRLETNSSYDALRFHARAYPR